MVFDSGFQFFHAADIGPVRTLVKRSPELQKVRLRPSRVDLYPAVLEIPCEAIEPQGLSPAAREVTKPDALYAPAHEPPPRLDLPGHELKRTLGALEVRRVRSAYANALAFVDKRRYLHHQSRFHFGGLGDV
jgi:hypothetical protein